MQYPAQEGRVADSDATADHHADQIAIEELGLQVPAQAQNDQLILKPAAEE